MDTNSPTNPNWWVIITKLIVWLIVWLVFSGIVFLMFVWLWASIDQAVANSANNFSFSPLIWLSFMWIWLIVSIVGSLIIAWIYNVLWNEDYYDMKIMSSWIWAINLLLFIPFGLLYFFVWTIQQSMENLFIVYWFHLFFSIFVSFIIMDNTKNPNYSSVSVIWNSFWFIIALLIFFIIYSLYSTKAGSWQKNILFYPTILSFSIIPFISAIWEKIYYKFYEMWNDFLYIPSISEVLVDEEENDEINVEN